VQEIAGLALGTVIARRATRLDPAILRWAVLAQLADLVTFAFIFGHAGQGERNPIARFLVDAAKMLFGSATNDQMFAVNTVTFAAMIALKLALIGFVVWVSARVGRYRNAVLMVAIAAGLIGAVSNFLALPLFMPPRA
jgi:hypothetical protein